MRLTTVFLAFILCFGLFAGCQTVNEVGVTIKKPSTEHVIVKHKGKGPPPHAPAHGYRYKHHDGVELAYDSQIGVYFAVKVPSVYFCNNLYMRLSDRHWEVAANFNGPWQPEKEGQVPYKLKKAKLKKAKNKKYKNK